MSGWEDSMRPAPVGMSEAARLFERLRSLPADPGMRKKELHSLRSLAARIWLGLPDAHVQEAMAAGLLDATFTISAQLAGEPLPPDQENLAAEVRYGLAIRPCNATAFAACALLGCLDKDEDGIFPAANAEGKLHLLPFLLNTGIDLERGGPERELRRLQVVTEQILAWWPGLPTEVRIAALPVLQTRYSILSGYFVKTDTVRLACQRVQLLHSLFESPVTRQDYQPLGPVPGDRRIRLGILAQDFRARSETFALLPVFEHLDPARFETILVAGHFGDTATETYCGSRAARVVPIVGGVQDLVKGLRALDLDIVLLGNNFCFGLGVADAAVGLHRVARIQVNFVCAPLTSGLPYVDRFLLGEATEPAQGSAQRYTETLVRLPGSGFCFSFQGRDETPGRTFSREDFGIRPEETVFVSGANYYKVLPEVRDTWARILAAVPDSVLLIYPFGPAWSAQYPQDAFVEAMLRAFDRHGVGRDRLMVVGPMRNHLEIRSLLACADVYLDAFPYSGATSLQDPLDAGLPVVVVEGDELRFRQGAAILREAGLVDGIARDPEDYRARAVRLGRDPHARNEQRRTVQHRMAQGVPFRDSRRYAEHVANALTRMVQDWNAGWRGASEVPTDPVAAPPEPGQGRLLRFFEAPDHRMIHKWMHYFEIYERHFERFRGRPITLVEIGVFQGGSLQMWRDYFGPQAQIVGVDINPMVRRFEAPGTRIRIGDQADPAFLSRLAAELPAIDILVDDGGHTMRQQITTFEVLYPKVSAEGVYLCEDLHTSYWPEYGGGPGRRTFIDVAKGLVDRLNGFHGRDPERPADDFTRSAHALHFYDSVLVIEKRRREAPVSRYHGVATIPYSSFPPPEP